MDERVTLTLIELTGDDAPRDVSRLLALVFEDETPASLLPRLGRLPVVVSRDCDPATAELLVRHLEARGARVKVDRPDQRPSLGSLGSGAAWDDDEEDSVDAPAWASAAPSLPVDEPPEAPVIASSRAAVVTREVIPARPRAPEPAPARGSEPASEAAVEAAPWESGPGQAAPWDGAPLETSGKKRLGGLFKGILGR